jgi:ATP adenylyltransferase
MVPDGGVEFLVRIVSNLARKEQLASPAGDRSPPPRNPFLPYEPALYVADASESHVCLLNKFNVVDHHLLIVTRQFEPQLATLNRSDFHALWRCMAEYDGLGFYHAGQVAGASQPHKHLQMVPLPLAPGAAAVPIEPLLREPARFYDQVGRATHLPFPHALARIDADRVTSPERAAEWILSRYQTMMRSIGLTADTPSTGAYNLLLTRDWMLLLPRRRETFKSISLNALAFAGALLVRDRQQLVELKRGGLMAALQHVTGECPGPP